MIIVFKIVHVTDDILKALSSNNREESKKQLANLKEHESIVTQYKDLIQEQVGSSFGTNLDKHFSISRFEYA